MQVLVAVGMGQVEAGGREVFQLGRYFQLQLGAAHFALQKTLPQLAGAIKLPLGIH